MAPSNCKPMLWVFITVLWLTVLVTSAPSARNRKSPPYIHDESYEEHGESSEENDVEIQQMVS